MFAVVAFFFTLPIFENFNNWGIQDWDQHLFYHAVPRASLLKYKQFPLWNPYNCGGIVDLANPQSRVLSPTFLFILLFDVPRGIKIDIWIHLIIGMFGVYKLTRYLNLNKDAAMLSSFIFNINSMFALPLTVGMTWFISVSYLPWVFHFYLKSLNHFKYACYSGLFLALMFFNGGAYPLVVTITFLALHSFLLFINHLSKKTAGWILIICGIISNEWALTTIFSPDGKLTTHMRTSVWGVNTILIGAGLFLLKYSVTPHPRTWIKSFTEFGVEFVNNVKSMQSWLIWKRKEFRPTLSLAVILTYSILIGAIKFFPSIAFIEDHPRNIKDYSGYSVSSLFQSLLWRDQSLSSIRYLSKTDYGLGNLKLWDNKIIQELDIKNFLYGYSYAMDENGMYIGIIPFLLCLMGIRFQYKHRKILILCFFVFLWFIFGNRIRPDIWLITHELPIYSSMRVAQRYRIVFMLCIAIFAGFGLHGFIQFVSNKINKKITISFLSKVILAGVLIDLIVVNSPVWKDAFTIPPLKITKSERFYQIKERGYSYDKDGILTDKSIWMYSAFGSLYPNFLSNIGTIGGYETARIPRRAIPFDSKSYPGEVFLHNTPGKVKILNWSPNRFKFEYNIDKPGYLVFNQNYYPGWKIKGMHGKVEKIDGLIGLKILPKMNNIEIYYLPDSFIYGFITTILTLIISIFFGVRNKWNV